ncbi:hypothetical protein [Caballeronia sp. J97]|nr:hypothetical protein [Caballeronia sp. J97]
MFEKIRGRQRRPVFAVDQRDRQPGRRGPAVIAARDRKVRNLDQARLDEL